MTNDQTVTQALKGCPFCGQAPTIEPWHGGAPTKVMIGCPGLHPDDDIAPCEVAPQVTGETPAEAISAWNTRTAHSGEVERLQRLVDAYRLLAVNEGWNHRMVDAYGHAEYLAHRIAEVDRKASGTVVSGYDAAKYLRDGLAALAQPEAGGER